MASVRMEEEAFADPRYTVLAKLCQLADEDHARGKMARLWRQCTVTGQYILPNEIVAAILGEFGPHAVVNSGLGELADGGIRIKGTKGRIEWLRRLRKNARKGGLARAAKRQPQGKQALSKTNPKPSALTLAPALTLALENTQIVPQGGRVDLLWSYQNELRAQAIPGCRALVLTKDRRQKIAALLEAGYTDDDLRAVQDEYARHAIADPKVAQWFNGETNWVKDNVARTLGRIGSSGSGKPVPITLDHEPSFSL